jgi:hypothetical protein
MQSVARKEFPLQGGRSVTLAVGLAIVLGVDGEAVDTVVGRRLRWVFARSAIASAERATWRSVPDRAADFVNTAKPLEPNVVVVMSATVDARLPLGIVKPVGRFGLRVADASEVVRLLSGG